LEESLEEIAAYFLVNPLPQLIGPFDDSTGMLATIFPFLDYGILWDPHSFTNNEII
jgi:hypothetical protein